MDWVLHRLAMFICLSCNASSTGTICQPEEEQKCLLCQIPKRKVAAKSAPIGLIRKVVSKNTILDKKLHTGGNSITLFLQSLTHPNPSIHPLEYVILFYFQFFVHLHTIVNEKVSPSKAMSPKLNLHGPCPAFFNFHPTA